MYTVQFTLDELNAMSQLLDLSIKQGGLGVAEAAVILNKKLIAAKNAAVETASDAAK